ncbi:MAG: glycosyltransferase family 2 protein [Planctomycetota bacterium]
MPEPTTVPAAAPPPTTDTPSVTVVVINYKTAQLTIDCLESLEPDAQADPGLGVVVVDNASGDDSPKLIAQAIADRGWSRWAQVIDAGRNGGFSAGNNTGMAHRPAPFYLLSNSDTLLRPGTVPALRRALEQDPSLGLVGPQLTWPDGSPQVSSFRQHTPITELLQAAQTGPLTNLFIKHRVAGPVNDQPIAPHWVSFACVMLRHELLEQAGPMDEGFFMYYEDVDYARRARGAGFTVRYLPAVQAVHLRGGSSPVKSASATRKRRPAYYYAARNRYYRNHYGLLGSLAANALWYAGRCVSLIREVVQRRPRTTVAREAGDLWLGFTTAGQPRPTPTAGPFTVYPCPAHPRTPAADSPQPVGGAA